MGQRRRRLSRSAEFDRVYRQGRAAGGRHLVLYAFERENDGAAESEEGARLGVSVGRRIGGSAERNEVKRLVREAFWELAAQLPADHDYVIVARPDSASLAERERLGGMRRELGELIEKLGLRRGSPPAGASEGEESA